MYLPASFSDLSHLYNRQKNYEICLVNSGQSFFPGILQYMQALWYCIMRSCLPAPPETMIQVHNCLHLLQSVIYSIEPCRKQIIL